MIHCKICGKPILATKFWCAENGDAYHEKCALSIGAVHVEEWLIVKGRCLWKHDYTKEELQEIVERLLNKNEIE